MLRECDGRIANLNHAVTERDGQIVNLSQAVAERDSQIASLNLAMGERDGQIVNLSQAVAERDSQIASLNLAMGERDGQIANLSQAAAERDSQIASLNLAMGERDGQIANLSQAAAERDSQIASLNLAMGERDGQIASLGQAVTERDGQTASLSRAVEERNRRIAEILDSTSWRLTWPARLVSHQIKRAVHLWRVTPKVIAHAGSVRSTCAAALRIYRRDGWAGVRLGLKRFQEAPILHSPPASTGTGSTDRYSEAPQFDKERARKSAEAELEHFLNSGQALDLPQSECPRISIVLVLYNQAGLTLRCLRSIAAEAHPVEVIAVDNASSDAIPQLVARVRGLRYVRNEENIGFLKAVNQAVRWPWHVGIVCCC